MPMLGEKVPNSSPAFPTVAVQEYIFPVESKASSGLAARAGIEEGEVLLEVIAVRDDSRIQGALPRLGEQVYHRFPGALVGQEGLAAEDRDVFLSADEP